LESRVPSLPQFNKAVAAELDMRKKSFLCLEVLAGSSLGGSFWMFTML
jgi:hypothetical protein